MTSLSKSSNTVDFPRIASPFSIRAMFWRARYLENSPMLEHLPLLFWLVDVHRPNLHVSLGVNDGVGYFGVCQAIDRLVPEARSFGIERRPTSSEKEWEKVLHINEDFYSDSSQIVEREPKDYFPEFQNGSIDLLIIDHPIDDVLADQIIDNWCSKLSNRAIILIHGIMREGFTNSPGGKLLKKLCNGHPSIRFENGDGIELILVGRDQNEYLRNLSSLSVEDANYSLTRAIFSRLGAAHRFEFSSRRAKIAMSEIDARQQTAQKELEETVRKLGLIEQDYTEKNRQAATFQAKCFDLEKVYRTIESERDALRSENAALLARERDLEASLNSEITRSKSTMDLLKSTQSELEDIVALTNSQAHEISRLKEELKEAELKISTRENELSRAVARTSELENELKSKASGEVALKAMKDRETQLSKEIERDRALIKALEPQLTELIKESLRLKAVDSATSRLLAQKDSQIEHLKNESVRLHESYDAILKSTSWSLTAPARKTVDWIRKIRD